MVNPETQGAHIGTDPLRKNRWTQAEATWANASWFGQASAMPDTDGYQASPLVGGGLGPIPAQWHVPDLASLLDSGTRPETWERTGAGHADDDLHASADVTPSPPRRATAAPERLGGCTTRCGPVPPPLAMCTATICETMSGPSCWRSSRPCDGPQRPRSLARAPTLAFHLGTPPAWRGLTPTVRLATFNVENLFTRFLFARGVDQKQAARMGFTSDDLRFRLADPSSKRLTAETMLAMDADVFALQEVEGLDVLKRFRDQHLGGKSEWPYALVIDGNDSRRIDVGVVSRFPIVHARSWQHLSRDERYVFDRDCLEVDIAAPVGTVTLYINHFKSMRAPNRSSGPGRGLTAPRRAAQARTVRDIVCKRFGPEPDEAPFVILGDFNDHLEDTHEGSCAIRELVQWSAVRNIVDRLPEDERWTHFFSGRRRSSLPPAYRQLDFVLPSRGLAERNPAPPEIERRGQPGRASRFTGERFEGVGHDRPKASDHCPILFEITQL